MENYHFIGYLVAAAVGVVSARCPGLQPPVNGVLKCQALGPDLLCTATCYAGYEFQTGLKVVERTCLSHSDTWLQGPGLPDCVRPCDDVSMDGKGRALSASSSFSPASLYGPRASLLASVAAWRPAADDILQYIQVDLGAVHRVRGWKVRGDGHGSYVTLFRLLFSVDGVTWTPYSDGRVMDKFFVGNFDSDTEVSQLLSVTHTARYIRVNPLSWHRHIAFSWGLIGCPSLSPQGTVSPTPTFEGPGCKAPLPPAGGAVNCERNGSTVVCTAYCLGGLVFDNLGPAIDMTCDPRVGHFTHTPLPACVVRNTSVLPFVNISGPCLQEERDCFHTDNGDYQYCGDCHYFSTCSEGYFFVRSCPEHLQYDSQRALCNYHSGTCSSSEKQGGAQSNETGGPGFV